MEKRKGKRFDSRTMPQNSTDSIPATSQAKDQRGKKPRTKDSAQMQDSRKKASQIWAFGGYRASVSNY